MENLFTAWLEFRRGKRNKPDVLKFEHNLEDNIFILHQQLRNKNYYHQNYTPFYITDPKSRHIHKASVRDRLVHHAVFRKLYPIFDKLFIFDSYSCRVGKGTHNAVNRLGNFVRKVSKNHKQNIWALKCDIGKFFDSVDQEILLELIAQKITDQDAMWLVKQILKSFETLRGKGIPLGNVTSQLFANIYLNDLDQFVKHNLRVKHYLRYCDDFIFLNQTPSDLEKLIPRISNFLLEKLQLNLHPRKIILSNITQGFDFLGYVILPHHRIVRTKTKRRICKKINIKREAFLRGFLTAFEFEQSMASYFGMLKHCNSYKLKCGIIKAYGLPAKTKN